jgi:hypothetical protein
MKTRVFMNKNVAVFENETEQFPGFAGECTRTGWLYKIYIYPILLEVGS